MAGTDCLADFSHDDLHDTVSRSPQDRLLQAMLEDLDRGCFSQHLGVGNGALFVSRPVFRRRIVGLRRRDVGVPGRYVRVGLVERLLRGKLFLRERRDAVVASLRIGKPRVGLADLRREHGDLLITHAGVNVIARRNGDRTFGTRLRERGRQFGRGQFGQHVSGLDALALANPDGRELSTDFRCNRNFCRAHDANNRGGSLGTQHDVHHGYTQRRDHGESSEPQAPDVSHSCFHRNSRAEISASAKYTAVMIHKSAPVRPHPKVRPIWLRRMRP